MINLLPPQVKQDIIYARRNAKMVKRLVAVGIATMGAIIIMVFGYLYLTQATNSYAKHVEEGKERLRAQQLEQTQSRVNELSANVKLVNQVLAREILFSKVLRQVGAAIPSGAILTRLDIEKVEGGIDLVFGSRDYQTGSQIVLNLQDPENKVFDKADIESITCDSSIQTEIGYPCSVFARALFGDNSPYLFINDKVGD